MYFARIIATIAGVLALGAGAVGVAAHFSGFVSTTATLIASFTPLFILSALVGAVLLAFGRQRVLAIVAVVVVAIGVWTQVPLYRSTGGDATAQATNLRIMQANMFHGRADADYIVSRVRDDDVDILTLVELTDAAVPRLDAAGLRTELPYSYVQPRGGGGGAGIYSRYPLGGGELLPGFELNNVRATVTVPGTPEFEMYALHPLPPYPEPSWKWAAELDHLAEVLDAETRPLIIGADFNSTFDHKQFRELLAGSDAEDSPRLIDAAAYLGSGIVPTYPQGRIFPPVLALDRILTRGGTPQSFERIDLPGSDHYGVIGEVRLDGSDQS